VSHLYPWGHPRPGAATDRVGNCSIVNILFTPPRYFGNRKSGFPCFSSWIFPTIQFHASLSNLPPTSGRRLFVWPSRPSGRIPPPPENPKIASGELMPPVTVCRVCGLTVMEVTRNVPPLQVRQVEAYGKTRAAAGKPAERPSAFAVTRSLIDCAQHPLQITRA